MEDKVRVEVIDVFGWAGAIEGMRNPKDSWELTDSVFDPLVIIGENDLNLMKRLIHGGPEHRKFLRMIHVQLNLWLPRYIWSEFDTYHFNVKNSCSTMHKLLTKNPITVDQFIYDEEDEQSRELIKITVGTLTTAINKLIKKGYVERKRIEEDRRVVLISLTKKGKLAYRLHEKFHKDRVNTAIDGVSEEQEEVLIYSLTELNTFFRKKYEL